MSISINKSSLISLASAVVVASAIMFVAVASAQDYDGDTEISGLSGIGGISGLTALANGVVSAGYAPAGGEGSDGERGAVSASESSDADSGDYDDDSNDSSASEDHPILSRFMNLLSGGRHKRSVVSDQLEQQDELVKPATSSGSLSRVKRGYKGWVPYVSTYAKTDKKAHFKWGVKAKVGKKYGRK